MRLLLRNPVASLRDAPGDCSRARWAESTSADIGMDVLLPRALRAGRWQPSALPRLRESPCLSSRNLRCILAEAAIAVTRGPEEPVARPTAATVVETEAEDPPRGAAAARLTAARPREKPVAAAVMAA
jgi:hypothetical protein